MRQVLRREGSIIAIVATYLTVGALIWAYETKSSCSKYQLMPCYSDIRALWQARGLGDHVFPYVHGGITEQGALYGGVVEYPTLSGLFMWVSGLAADDAAQFLLHSALLLAPFALAVTLMLAWLARWHVLLWSATPPLMMYAYLNWELPVVAMAVAAIAVMAWGSSARPDTGERRLSLRTSAVLASVLLALGFAFKIYPGLFVLPLALYVLTRGGPDRHGRDGPASRRLDVAGAAYVTGAAVLTVLATQVPFMLAGYEGWRAALEFQSDRRASIDTNTFWYWGVRQLSGASYDDVVALASPLLILAALTVALLLGVRVYNRTGAYPWIGVSAAMLAGFMLFHKVHSPQYMLWLLPFFVLLKVRWSIVATYFAADLLLNLTVFRMLKFHTEDPDWAIPVVVAVYVQLILLAILLVTFVGAPLREPLASYMRGAVPGPGPLTRLWTADGRSAAHWLGSPTLSGHRVILRPLEVADAGALAAVIAAETGDGYRWLPALPHDTESTVAWIRHAADDPGRIAFAVIDADTGELVGTTSFYDVDERQRSLAVGYTFYSPAVRGTRINPAAKLLLLEHAFDDRGAVRVVWHTHSENARSRAAIAKLGATVEGEFSMHKRFGDGWRTTAQYAMTLDDWPAVRSALAARVAGYPSADSLDV